jgi:hypothetical protein
MAELNDSALKIAPSSLAGPPPLERPARRKEELLKLLILEHRVPVDLELTQAVLFALLDRDFDDGLTGGRIDDQRVLYDRHVEVSAGAIQAWQAAFEILSEGDLIVRARPEPPEPLLSRGHRSGQLFVGKTFISGEAHLSHRYALTLGYVQDQLDFVVPRRRDQRLRDLRERDPLRGQLRSDVCLRIDDLLLAERETTVQSSRVTDLSRRDILQAFDDHATDQRGFPNFDRQDVRGQPRSVRLTSPDHDVVKLAGGEQFLDAALNGTVGDVLARLNREQLRDQLRLDTGVSGDFDRVDPHGRVRRAGACLAFYTCRGPERYYAEEGRRDRGGLPGKPKGWTVRGSHVLLADSALRMRPSPSGFTSASISSPALNSA